jgi:hypothetical protein
MGAPGGINPGIDTKPFWLWPPNAQHSIREYGDAACDGFESFAMNKRTNAIHKRGRRVDVAVQVEDPRAFIRAREMGHVIGRHHLFRRRFIAPQVAKVQRVQESKSRVAEDQRETI